MNCPECRRERITQPKNSWEDILKRFRDKWGEKYSYDETTYAGFKIEMTVHCNDCKETFQITPEHHLKYNNGGCPNCHKYKTVICSCCKKEILIDRHCAIRENYVCKDCHDKIKEEHKQQKECVKNAYLNKHKKHQNKVFKDKTITICPFCGQTHKIKEKCSHELCNCFHSINVLKKLIPFGFDYSSIGSLRYFEEFKKATELLIYEYYDNKLSPCQIFLKYNCKEYFKSEGTLRYFLKNKLRLNTRGLSEAQKNAIDTGISNIKELHSFQFKIEYHKSWEGNIYLLRSSYESDFANMLDESHVIYEVETLHIRYLDTQKQIERIAIPDFYLPDTNTIVEIKSIYTLNIQNMKDRRDAYIAAGYNFKLILDHKECNLDELIQSKNNNQFEELKKYCERGIKTRIGSDRKYRWMHNNIERIKVALDEIEYYQSLGWILGGLSPQQQQVNIANNVQPCAELPKK